MKKEPEEESNLPDMKVEEFTQVEVKEEPETNLNVYVKQELNEDDVNILSIKKENDNISDYEEDFETSVI